MSIELICSSTPMRLSPMPFRGQWHDAQRSHGEGARVMSHTGACA